MKYIDAEKLEEEIESISLIPQTSADYNDGRDDMKMMFLDIINSLQKEQSKVDLIIHTIIAECCDWLAMNTNLSHDKIEDCRNLMLTVKEEQFKAQKGE